jgi:hypothetical protein
MTEKRCRKCGADEAAPLLLVKARGGITEWECGDDAACLLRQRGEDPAPVPAARLKQIRDRAALAYASPARCAESAADVPALLALHDAAEARWTALRAEVERERDAHRERAGVLAREGSGGESLARVLAGTLDWLLATMDRMEQS